MNDTEQTPDRREETFLIFARILIDRFAKESPDGKIVLRSKRLRRFESEEPFADVDEVDIDAYFNGGILIEVKAIDAVRECIQSHIESGVLTIPTMSDGDGNTIKEPNYDQYGWCIIRSLSLPIIRAISQFRKVEDLTDENILECYQKYVEHWIAAETRTDHLIPIQHLGWSDQPLQLDEHTSIHKFSSDLKFELYHSFGDLNPMSLRDFGDSHSIITIEDFRRRGETQDDRQKGDRQVRNKIVSILASLRLEGYQCGARCVFIRRHAPQPQMTGPIGAGFVEEFDIQGSVPRSEVKPQSHEAIKRCIEAVEEASDQHVRLAVRRFNLAVGRRDIEDKVIDLTIALESLLVAADTELSYRLKLAASHLLRAEQKPQTTFDTVSAMYALRSAIVHTGARLNESPTKSTKRILRKVSESGRAVEAVDCFRQITRLVLREIIRRMQLGKNLEDIQSELEKCALGQIPPPNETNPSTQDTGS